MSSRYPPCVALRLLKHISWQVLLLVLLEAPGAEAQPEVMHTRLFCSEKWHILVQAASPLNLKTSALLGFAFGPVHK